MHHKLQSANTRTHIAQTVTKCIAYVLKINVLLFLLKPDKSRYKETVARVLKQSFCSNATLQNRKSNSRPVRYMD